MASRDTIPRPRAETGGALKLAYLASHPIQYQAPLLRRIAQEPGILLKVFFGANTAEGAFDGGFGRPVRWDVPLLDGYDYEILPGIGARSIGWARLNPAVARRLWHGRFDAVLVHGYTRLTNLIAIGAAKRLGVRVLVRDEAHEASSRRGRAKRVAGKAFYRLLDRLCDAFLAIGTLNARYYENLGISPNKIFLMPYAVDNDFFRSGATHAAGSRAELRRKLSLPPDRPVILFSGKFCERKRPQDLLRAYFSLSGDGIAEPPACLLFAGEGALRLQLESEVQARGWRSVKFLGFKNQTELPALYDLCDLLVLPSLIEPWGLVVNEAMNAGCAIIVADRVGCGPDLVRPGVNGFIFKAGDVEQLTVSMREAIADPARLSAMGEASRGIVRRWSYDQDITGLRSAFAALGMTSKLSRL